MANHHFLRINVGLIGDVAAVATSIDFHDALPFAAPPSSVMNSRRSFDHLVHASEQLRWHFEPKRLGRLQVDDELEFGRLQHWEVGELRALEDFDRS